ncbi:MAG: hypothetical protein E7580_02065 [Ruminococcaceae bacterium]|nr:hypothetical protein [Oscillospiraceae bacterium]
MKHLYLDVMEKAAKAYTVEQIDEYIKDVEENGLQDHGFPRLSANLAVLIANGRCTELFSRVEAMLELSFKLVSKTIHCDNDFSVRELCVAFLALQQNKTFPEEQLRRWLTYLSEFDPERGYEMLVWKKEPDWKCHNIVSYNCLSEFLRCKLLGLDADPFLKKQLPKVLESFDENGMYMDPGCPMVYDFATRLNLQQMLFAGYKGVFASEILERLEKADSITLKFVSATGEFPYGGRSQGFLHNEALFCALLEGAALRSKAKGDLEAASRYRAGAKLSLDCLTHWINKDPVSHIKNRFPAQELMGCETYGYFNKYMITVNIWLMTPLLYADDSIPVGTLTSESDAFSTSPYFHRYFLKAGDYSLQGDTAGQVRQDATGIGRIHKKGCPSPLLLSFPCPENAKYITLKPNPGNAAIGVWKQGEAVIFSECDKESTVTLNETVCAPDFAGASLTVTFADESTVTERVSVTPDGITLTQEGGDGFLLPAIVTDGENEGSFFAEKDGFSVLYQEHHVRYRFLGTAEEAGIYQNRSGIYRFYRVRCNKVHISMGGKR